MGMHMHQYVYTYIRVYIQTKLGTYSCISLSTIYPKPKTGAWTTFQLPQNLNYLIPKLQTLHHKTSPLNQNQVLGGWGFEVVVAKLCAYFGFKV